MKLQPGGVQQTASLALFKVQKFANLLKLNNEYFVSLFLPHLFNPNSKTNVTPKALERLEL